MRKFDGLNRRHFLAHSLAGGAALGMGVLVGRNLFADRPQLAARIEEAPKTHPLAPALKLGSESLSALDGVRDYKCTFIKRELVGKKLLDSKMELKLREDPFSVYLKFIKPHAGREVIYIRGQNGDKLLAHETGFASLAGTLSLDPTGSTAMSENRHPITSIGMRNLVAKLLEQWLEETSIEGMTVNYFPNARIGQTSCKAIETSHPKKRTGTTFQLSRLYVDATTGHPIRVQQYDFPGPRDKEAPLVEDYLYSDLEVNVGLGDIDFSTKNPKYGY